MYHTDGWIWSFKPCGGMSDEDVEKWVIEGELNWWLGVKQLNKSSPIYR